jgi:hypothetical protein
MQCKLELKMADKGIRPASLRKFLEESPARVAGTLTNTQFRKNVMCWLMEQFGITISSAATHYNEAFKAVKVSHPDLVVGLGRPEDKKGGRKKKVATVEVKQDVANSALLLQNMMKAVVAPVQQLQPKVLLLEDNKSTPDVAALALIEQLKAAV